MTEWHHGLDGHEYLCPHEFVSVICIYLYMHQYSCAYIPSPHDTKSQLIRKDPDAGKD